MCITTIQQSFTGPTTFRTNETRCGFSRLRDASEGTAGPRDVSRSPALPPAASQRKDALNARLQHLQPEIEQENVSFSVCSSRQNTLHPRVSSRPEKREAEVEFVFQYPSGFVFTLIASPTFLSSADFASFVFRLCFFSFLYLSTLFRWLL